MAQPERDYVKQECIGKASILLRSEPGIEANSAIICRHCLWSIGGGFTPGFGRAGAGHRSDAVDRHRTPTHQRASGEPNIKADETFVTADHALRYRLLPVHIRRNELAIRLPWPFTRVAVQKSVCRVCVEANRSSI